MGPAELLGGLALMFLFGGKKQSSGSARSGGAAAPGGKSAIGEALLKRANQAAALAWADTFKNEGVPADFAEALARWAGIESSGKPTAVSKLGERGLLQVSDASHKDGAVSDYEWAAMIDPSTTRAEHAHINVDLAAWLYSRALNHITNPPPLDDHIAAAWYGKLYHGYPVDVRDGKLHGPPLEMARELAKRWAASEPKMKRLMAANVVAFGNPTP